MSILRDALLFAAELALTLITCYSNPDSIMDGVSN